MRVGTACYSLEVRALEICCTGPIGERSGELQARGDFEALAELITRRIDRATATAGMPAGWYWRQTPATCSPPAAGAPGMPGAPGKRRRLVLGARRRRGSRIAGAPAVTLDTGAPVWNHVDPAAPSEAFLESFAAALAAIQAVPANEMPTDAVDTIDAARERLDRAVRPARELLEPTAAPLERWQRFVAGDTWPDHVALVHGDLPPGHLLLDDAGRLTGIIDWTDARVTDPGVDLAMFAGCFGRGALERLLPRFERRSGRTWPRLVDHALERWAMFPALGAEWAHRTGNAAVLQYARDQLAAQEAAS